MRPAAGERGGPVFPSRFALLALALAAVAPPVTGSRRYLSVRGVAGIGQGDGAGLYDLRAGGRNRSFRHAGDHRRRLRQAPAGGDAGSRRPSSRSSSSARSRRRPTFFSGWMFASSPALSPLQHPVYDLWVLDCVGQRAQRAGQRFRRRIAVEAARPPQRLVEQLQIARRRHLDRAELLQMRR